MNAIQILNRIDFYNDQTRSARFQRVEYDNAVNDACAVFVEKILKPSGFASKQYVSDQLYTLVKTVAAAPSSNITLYPADYLGFLSLTATIGGTAYFCRPITHNELGPLLTDSYRAPSDTKPYYLQQTTGFLLLKGSGTITTASLTYVKTPQVYSCGKDTQLINAGVGVLTLAATYLCTEPCTQNGVNYQIGDSFVAAGTTTLALGQVILASQTTTLDTPPNTHEEICKIASSLMMGATSDYNKSAFSEKEANKS